MRLPSICVGIASHSVRVRGLKYFRIEIFRRFVLVALCTSAWIEIPLGFRRLNDLTSHSVRVRGLKWVFRAAVHQQVARSHSVRVRGLKSMKTTQALRRWLMVALCTSAWIEITSGARPWIKTATVALCTSAWIEIAPRTDR